MFLKVYTGTDEQKVKSVFKSSEHVYKCEVGENLGQDDYGLMRWKEITVTLQNPTKDLPNLLQSISEVKPMDNKEVSGKSWHVPLC